MMIPIQRSYVANEVVDRSQQPCGGANTLGVVHFTSKPGSRNFIGWRVINPAPQGNCTVRIGLGPNEDDFKVLFPADGSADETGSFPCGRQQSPLEGKEFKFPYNFTCDDCALQLEWRTNSNNKEIQFHYCGDVDVLEKEEVSCMGKC